MKVDEMINVMVAYANGEDIEFRDVDEDLRNMNWSYIAFPAWNWSKYEYRIAPSKKESSRFMTNRQLSELLQKGYGTWIDQNALSFVHAGYSYALSKENDIVTDKWIRPWGSDEWIEPTVDIYEEFMNRKEKDRRYQNIKISIKKLNGDDFEVESEPDEETIKDYSDAGHREAEPSIGERFLCKGKLYECIECNDCDKCALNETSCYAFNCNERKDGKSVVFVDVSKTENTTASEDSSSTISKEESVGIHRRTPQEISDFFDCYVTMDEKGSWYMHEHAPMLKPIDRIWVCKHGKSLLLYSLCSDALNILDIPVVHNWRTLYRPHMEPLVVEEEE